MMDQFTAVLSKGCGPRGADMGRGNVYTPSDEKLHVVREKLDSGGYDRGGAYWGLRANGWRLYRVWNSGTEMWFDAPDGKVARQLAMAAVPGAVFYRS